MSEVVAAHDQRVWRLAAGLTVDDRGGALQIYVAENQRGFAIAGVAAEIFLDLLAAMEKGWLTRLDFVDGHADRYDTVRLSELWAAAVAAGVLIPAGGLVVADAHPTAGLALMNVAENPAADLLLRELADLEVPLTRDSERPTLVVALDDVGDDWRLIEIGRSLPWQGVPWLPIQLLHDRVCVGPVVFPGDTACFECALTRRAAALVPDGVRRWGRQSISRPGPVERRAAAKVASALVRHQLIALLNSEPPSLTARRLTYDLSTCSQTISFVLEVPGCRTCRETDGILS